MKPRLLSLAVALLLATVSTGCFGLFGGSSEPDQSAVITVLNDVDPPREVTVEIRRSGDDASNLGTVSAGAQRDLTYRSSNLQGAYQLVARQPSGAAIVSREFTLFPDARVRWQMRTNSVTVSQEP